MKRSLLILVLLASFSSARAADPERLALAHDVIKASHADKLIDSMTAQMQQMAASAVRSSGLQLSPDKQAKAEAMQKEIIDTSMEMAKGVITKMDEIYAEVYTLDELRAIKTFMESTEGRAMIEKQPALMQKLMPAVMEMQQTLGPKIQAIVKKYSAEDQAAK